MTQPILRPNFTKNIYQHYIQKGKSLNIFGADGVGKGRFVEDLKLLIDDETHVITLNMRNLRTDYSKFIRRLEEKLQIKDGFDRVELVLEKFSRKKGQKILVLKEFESLFELNHHEKFDFEFFEQLNSFKNREDVILLLLSTHNYKHEPFYKDGELTTSPLNITSIEEITPLLQKEIERELERNITKELGFEMLASLIMGKEKPYALLQFIIEKLEMDKYDDSESLWENFDVWEEEFSEKYGMPLEVKARKIYKKTDVKGLFSLFGDFIGKIIKG